MCGISFVLTTETYNSKCEDFMKDSLIVNQVRGMHSTGVFQVATSGDISYFKQAVHASNFVEIKEAKELIGKAARSRLTVGHVRHATQGAKDKTENAHPFMVTREDGSKLIGVHNGNFRSFKNKKNSKDFDVDSAWAFQMLADENADAFEHFDGAFALVWYDTNHPDTLFMARNKERPLHYMVSDDGKTMYGMSELGSLGWLTGRKDIKKDKEGFMFIEPGWLYRFDLKKPGLYTRAKYPEYDPKTTVNAPVSSVYDHADWEGYEGFHRPPFRQASPGWTSGSSSRRVWDSRTQQYVEPVASSEVVDYAAERTYRILENVKLALKQARQKRDSTNPEAVAEATPIIDQAALDRQLEDGISDAIRNFRNNKSSSLVPLSTLPAPMFLANIKDREVKRDELKTAQSLQIYGMVVDFTPILYDDLNETVWGEAEICVHGKWDKFETALRGITPRRGNFLYHPKRGAHRVTLCGYGTRQQENLPNYYIASEMHDSGKQLILERVNRLASAH